MVTIAVGMVRDEADLIVATAGHMLTQVDGMIVADNGSTDGTREILKELGVEVVDDPEIAYFQSRKVSKLAAMALEQGATWIVAWDADERWSSRSDERVADCLARHEPDYGIVQAEVFDYVATAVDPSEDDEPDPTRRLQWRRPNPLELCKVACRAAPDLVVAQGNHWATYPVPARPTEWRPLLVRHWPYRSVEQFIGKVRRGSSAYKATEGLPPEIGAHWRQWGEFTDEELADVFRRFFWRANPGVKLRIDNERQPPLVHDPVQ